MNGDVLRISGVTMGIMQIVRGVGAQPEAMMAPSKGKWWDDNEGKWVYTNLQEEAKSMTDVPEDDSDLLQDIAEEIDLRASTAGGEVKDPYYYTVLEVDPKADPSAIKRRVCLYCTDWFCDVYAYGIRGFDVVTCCHQSSLIFYFPSVLHHGQEISS